MRGQRGMRRTTAETDRLSSRHMTTERLTDRTPTPTDQHQEAPEPVCGGVQMGWSHMCSLDPDKEPSLNNWSTLAGQLQQEVTNDTDRSQNKTSI